MKIVGVTGQAGSGKDTFVGYFKAALPDTVTVQTYSFADPLKRGIANMFGISLIFFYDQKLKNQKVYGDWTPRSMMQFIGTDLLRNQFDQDVWIKRAEKEIWLAEKQGVDFFIVPDIRFNNEAHLVHNRGGVVYSVVRDQEYQEHHDHASEQGIDRNLIDKVILNNGTLEDLKEQAENFAKLTWG